MTEIDVIMLSNANTVKKYWMTHNAVQSILKSTDKIKFNIVVFETARKMPDTDKIPPWKEDKCYASPVLEDHTIRVDQVNYPVPKEIPVGTPLFINEFRNQFYVSIGANNEVYNKKHMNDLPSVFNPTGPVQYIGAKTVEARFPFNYNQVINDGLKITNNEWVFVMNNDTITHPGCFDKLISCGYDSVSPISDINQPGQIGVKGVEEGYRICRHISGFCIGSKRYIFSKLRGGKMDETFWYFHQDCDYSTQLYYLGIKHAVVGDAVVTHLQKQSHPDTKEELEWSLESTRRFYYVWPNDYIDNVTGIHTGSNTKEEIFDKTWTENFRKEHPEYDEMRKKLPELDKVEDKQLYRIKENGEFDLLLSAYATAYKKEVFVDKKPRKKRLKT